MDERLQAVIDNLEHALEVANERQFYQGRFGDASKESYYIGRASAFEEALMMLRGTAEDEDHEEID